jgi:hypothetical protein
MTWAGAARAEQPPPSPSEMDGVHVTIGPVGAVTHIEDSWYSAAGAELSLVYLREHCLPAAVGLAGGGISYAGRDGGRLWLEAEVAFNRPLPFGIGVSGGVVAEVDPVAEPRYGVQGTLWVFAGVIPYVRAGTVDVSGDFVEIGVMVKIPAVRFF